MEPDPRPVRARRATRRASASSGPWSAGEVRTTARTAPSSSCGSPTTTTSPVAAARSTGSTADSGTVAPPVVTVAGPAQHDQAAVDQQPAVPDRGEPVGVPAQRPGGAGVPVADEAATGPRSPRRGPRPPRRGTAAGPRRARPRRRRTARRRRSSGARSRRRPRPGRAAPGESRSPATTTVTPGSDGPATPGQVAGGEVGVRRVREVVDEPRPGDRRVHGREQVHRRGERPRHPDAGVRGQPGQPGDGVERGDPGVRRTHHGAGRAGGPGRAQADGFPRRVGGQEVRDLRQACAPRAGGGERRAGPGRPRARRARRGPRPRP